MLPSVVLSVLFWRENAYDALTASALIVDRLLQMISAALPILLVLVLSASVPVARVCAVGASICSALLGLSASLAALRPPADIFPTVLGLICLIVGGVCTVWLTQRVIIASRWRFSLLGLLALLPVIQFWHQTSFVPSSLVTSMSISPAVVNVQSQTSSGNRVSFRLQLQNAGEVGALILQSRIIMCPRAFDAVLISDINVLQSDTQCRSGSLITNQSVIDGETSFPYVTTLIALKDQPLLQVVVGVWYVRSDRLRIAPDPVTVSSAETASCSLGHIATYRLLDESKIKGLVQKERLITFHGSAHLSAYSITTRGEPLCGPGENELSRYFGVRGTTSSQTIWLPVR